jgi:L-iditol 2-dehydrogenase
MGHEAAGEIDQVGPKVEGWAAGDRVTFDSTVYCGRCPACERGAVNLCEHREVLGVSPGTYRRHGAMADYLVVPARILHRVPPGLPFEHAAFAEPLCIALHAVSRVHSADSPHPLKGPAVVIGAGMIGLLVIQVLRHFGCSSIVAVDRNESRLRTAAALGATATVPVDGTGEEQTLAAIRHHTGEAGAPLILEVVGIEPTLSLAVKATALGGQLVLVGNLSPEPRIPLQRIVTGELTVFGSCGTAGDHPLALRLLEQGAIQVAPLLSHLVPLAEGPEWFKRLSSPAGAETLKVVLQP